MSHSTKESCDSVHHLKFWFLFFCLFRLLCSKTDKNFCPHPSPTQSFLNFFRYFYLRWFLTVIIIPDSTRKSWWCTSSKGDNLACFARTVWTLFFFSILNRFSLNHYWKSFTKSFLRLFLLITIAPDSTKNLSQCISPKKEILVFLYVFTWKVSANINHLFSTQLLVNFFLKGIPW